jgi:arylsulfatase
MKASRKLWLALLAFVAVGMAASLPATAQQRQQQQPPQQQQAQQQQQQQQQTKPNILFIMGDDIGWMQPSIYHQGLMVGETPNIDRIGQEGAKFMDYVAMQSCTSGRNAFSPACIRCAPV